MSDAFPWVKELADAMRAAGAASCQYQSGAVSYSLTLFPSDPMAQYLPDVAPAVYDPPPPATPLERKRLKYAEVFGRPMSDADLNDLPDEPGAFVN